MANAKKLHSGAWRVQVYAGKDENGKRKYKSFTALKKREAELNALEWQEHYKEIEKDSLKMSFEEASQKYIDMKKNVFSPATYRTYDIIKRNNLTGLMKKQIGKITSDDIQHEINRELEKYSPKTVSNHYGFVTAVMHEFRPDFIFKAKLPQIVPSSRNELVSQYQIGLLLKSIQGDIAEIAILFAIWLGMRRSEIIGLKWEDVDLERKLMVIRNVKVEGIKSKFVDKGPKSQKSFRTLQIPDYINNKLKHEKHKTEYVVNLSSDIPRRHLQMCCERVGLPKIRLHDLRHAMASVGTSLNIADKFMMERGGWSTNSVMKNIYQYTFSDERKSAEARIDKYFEDSMSNINITQNATQKK